MVSRPASEWIASLESGTPRDSAIRGLVGKVGDHDTDAAFQWLLAIENESIRYHSLSKVAYDMANSDPDAGLLTIQESTLTTKEKEKMAKTIRKHLENLRR